ncbi:hypothetical protein CRE_19862 [Caenorhabditis remanei]|uniref:Uncharacterized protein n=1 Tax=Caenorhabditis remanei TaxID=31234 RepID=E3MTC5_CAERE|nr:hypothetical protein CRE_19862 [Caenorhabditis remanei]
MTYCSASYQFSYLDTPEFYTTGLHILSMIAIPIHLFGAYCILFKTPETMSSVKFTMFNFHMWILLVDLVFTVLVSPFPLFPLFAAGVFGLLDGIGVNRTFQTFLQFGTVETMYIGMILIFENRYLIITDANKYWKAIRKPWTVLNYICAVSVGIPFYLMIPENQESSKSKVFERSPRPRTCKHM